MPNKKSKVTPESTTQATEVEGFNIKINEFGEVVCTHELDTINEFLDENVEDKKLIDRDDLKKG